MNHKQPTSTAAQYITNVYGVRTFARALDLNDTESIMDLMNDFASHYANAKLDEAAENWTLPGENEDKYVETNFILSLKDKILC